MDDQNAKNSCLGTISFDEPLPDKAKDGLVLDLVKLLKETTACCSNMWTTEETSTENFEILFSFHLKNEETAISLSALKGEIVELVEDWTYVGRGIALRPVKSISLE